LAAQATRKQKLKKKKLKKLSNLTKGDIARMQKKILTYLLSYLPGGSTHRVVVLGGCTWEPNFGKGKAVGVSGGTIRNSDDSFL